MRIPEMTRVHPNVIINNNNNNNNNSKRKEEEEEEEGRRKGEEVVLTVWKKSLLFNCNGYTVFDGKGNLIFRVDNYYMTTWGSKDHILLMDASGKPLLTIHRKRVGLGESWLVYEGESSENPRFTARKHTLRSLGKCMVAHVGPLSGDCATTYEIEGCYAQRSCSIYDCGPSTSGGKEEEEKKKKKKKRRLVAEMKKKEALGLDVFRFVVWPRLIDSSLAMAFVILHDQMFA